MIKTLQHIFDWYNETGCEQEEADALAAAIAALRRQEHLELIGAEYQHTETGRIIACIGNTPPSTHWRHVRNIYAGP